MNRQVLLSSIIFQSPLDEEGVLVIDDPNSYYDSDEYDSDGKLIRKDEIKKQLLEEERLQRKLKRKPNTPHLVKKYIPVPMNPG
jgi:hypothetical protein